ncbi:MAG: hypothetical protein HYZ20_03710 [Burkholderiales bacterium]|nr:hypothetical protein [Burkholderiales bacterium]
MKRTVARWAAAAALGSWVGLAAQASDLDALDLQVQESQPVAAQDGGKRWRVEGSIGHADHRLGLGSRSIGRIAVEGRHTQSLGPRMRTTVSARLDASRPADGRIENPVFSLREAYLGWQDDGGASAWEIGRVNLREGPGYGYNPSDFLRDSALRTISTQDPFTLRENRMGVFMLRAQRNWDTGSLSGAFAPKLASTASRASFSADLGATNARHRALVSLGTRWSAAANTQLSLYQEEGSSARLGASGSLLLTDATVAHAEWSFSREPDLLARALGLDGQARTRQRGAVGLTYTTPTRLSLTLEAQYNGFALDREGWLALRSTSTSALPAYYATAILLQDNAARDAVMAYAIQRDLGVKNLELTALGRLNATDRSRLLWLELRYRMDRADLALQWQSTSGTGASEYAVAPIKRSISALVAVYF